jgi:hypothetical protein
VLLTCTPTNRWVIIHPASTKRTAALLRTDAVEWFAGVSLALNIAQLGAVLVFVLTSGRFAFSPAGIAAALTRAPLRALAAPMFGLGLVFKVTIFSAIGKKGVYYGAKFGHDIPWVHGFPFSVTGALPSSGAVCAPQLQHARAARWAKFGRAGRATERSRCFVPWRRCRGFAAPAAHPQYLGSSLCITAAGIALYDAAHPGHMLLPAWWVTLYVLTGLAEEGLCHSCEPFAARPAGADPLQDAHSRPVVRGAVRVLRARRCMARAVSAVSALSCTPHATLLCVFRCRRRLCGCCSWRPSWRCAGRRARSSCCCSSWRARSSRRARHSSVLRTARACFLS